MNTKTQAEGLRCVICSADEPHSGTCGSNDPRALCNLAAAPAIAPAGDAVAAFRVWWGTNAPPGTVISDPNWWADRIIRRLAAPQDGEADR